MSGTRIRAIVVDDEPLAREGLAEELRERDIEVVAVCGDGFSARDAILTHTPDVAFLDIQMPEIDGFALLEQLEPEEVPPVVIFVTAFDQHAVRAFEARAFDYLLKPVSPARLDAAIARAHARLQEIRTLRQRFVESQKGEGTDSSTSLGMTHLTHFVVRDRDEQIVIPIDDLTWIEAETYYVRLHSTNTKPRLLRERMSVLEARLDPARFYRTHRSAIVRLDLVRSIRTVSRYEHAVLLSTGESVPLSRERKPRLEALLKGA